MYITYEIWTDQKVPYKIISAYRRVKSLSRVYGGGGAVQRNKVMKYGGEPRLRHCFWAVVLKVVKLQVMLFENFGWQKCFNVIQ